MKIVEKGISRLRKNSKSTSKNTIVGQMLEERPLPLGRKEFQLWSDRIISGALVPFEGDPDVFNNSQKATLAAMILHLGPTECHKPDAFFIHSLRKAAANQVAVTIGTELREAAKARLLAEEAKRKEDEAKLNEDNFEPIHEVALKDE